MAHSVSASCGHCCPSTAELRTSSSASGALAKLELADLLKSDRTTEPIPNTVPFAYEWPLHSQQDHSERVKLSIWVSIFSVCLPLLKMAMLICVLKCCEREAPPTPRATHKNILNSKGSRTCQSCYTCATQTSVKISCFCEQILQRAEFGCKSFREYFHFPFLCFFVICL